MTNKDNGGPAFPCEGKIGEVRGMTIRDYFAAKAMQSFVTSWPDDHKVNATNVSTMSYQIADAMLEARK